MSIPDVILDRRAGTYQDRKYLRLAAGRPRPRPRRTGRSAAGARCHKRLGAGRRNLPLVVSVEPFGDLRTDGQTVFEIDVGSDLGPPGVASEASQGQHVAAARRWIGRLVDRS